MRLSIYIYISLPQSTTVTKLQRTCSRPLWCGPRRTATDICWQAIRWWQKARWLPHTWKPHYSIPCFTTFRGRRAREFGQVYEKYFDLLRQFPVHAPKHSQECGVCLKHPALRMPCNHPICPHCLMNYAWTEVGHNKKTEIRCWFCTSEWPLHIIQDYGNVLAEEMELLQERLSINFIVNDPDISECPGCSNYCERKGISISQVYCQICSKLGKPHTYCWYCCKPWNNSDSNPQCGNGGCNAAMTLQMLR